ncbi:MAG: hypothetical protein DMF65_14540 [Acidobacteria bacterium]|nr:MAG: hypothetical protein DMF65_14540 [Acidobacteriota bacterium]
MLTLYSAILAQHPRQLTPVCCAEPTIVQLYRYFEDVVLENNLAALVVESLLPESQRSLRDITRVREVGRSARYAFFSVSPDDALCASPLSEGTSEREPILMKKTEQAGLKERFIVIADARFSASALEYLMARVTAELPTHAHLFSKAVRTCVPKTTSLQLTVSVTTKLARLLQEQAVREIAVNRISTAIRSSLELPSVLQTTVNEVGRALGAQYSALSVESEHGQPSLNKCYFRDGDDDDETTTELLSDLEAYGVRLRGRIKTYVHDGTTGAGESDSPPVAAVPVIYHDRTARWPTKSLSLSATRVSSSRCSTRPSPTD